jgi:uncharacterized membrane protein
MAANSSGNMVKETIAPAGGIGLWLKRHWLAIAVSIISIYVLLPWLAPVFMALGWTKAANAIYLVYMTQCHQMPQRSFFLFGGKPMYSLTEVQSTWSSSANPLELRRFIGNSEMAWKVAWSDRMVFMYSSIILWSVFFFYPLRRKLKQLPWWGFILLLMPMAIDGGTHFISDIAGGIGSGFRYSNLWLATLTGNVFPVTFYVGDALGSFNSWMRLLTGILFALGVVWFIFPYLGLKFLGRSYDHE